MKLKKLLNTIFSAENIRLYTSSNEVVFEGTVDGAWDLIRDMNLDDRRTLKKSKVYNIELQTRLSNSPILFIWVDYNGG